MLESMINFCPECGFRLEKEYRFCPNCGIKLGHEIYETNKNSSGPSHPDKSQNAKKNKGSVAAEVQPPKLSTRALLSIISVIVGFIAITLLASGVFDTPKINTVIQQPVNNNQGSGVDLSRMQEIKDLEDKVTANPNDYQLVLQLGHLKNDAGLYEQAIVSYKKYLAANAKDADARVDMGVCYFNLKNYDAAIAEMKEALKYKPDHQIAHMNLGVVYMASGKLDEAMTWFQKAIDLGPDNEIGKKAKELLESHK
jgi:tetratricopeptide (TPR) repeat protein